MAVAGAIVFNHSRHLEVRALVVKG